MKTKLIVNEGKAKIVLTCENEFEVDLIEKIKDSRGGYKIETEALRDYDYHNHHKNHRIEINLLEEKDIIKERNK